MPKLTLFCLLGLIFFAQTSIAQERERPQLATAPESVRKPLLAHEWKRAEAELDRLLARDDGTDDHWLLLRAVAERGAGKLEEAEGTLQTLEREHTTSVWLHKSKFMRADIYRELHRYEEAVRVFEEAAQRLRSDERQAELAGIYFEFADALSADLDPSQPRSNGQDFERARVLYRKVLELEAPQRLHERATYRVAACSQSLQSWREAADQYRAYLTEFGDASEGTNAEIMQADRDTDGRVLSAWFELAKSEEKAGLYAKARRGYEDFAALLIEYREGPGGVLELSAQDEWCGQRSAELEELAANALFSAANTYRSGRSESQLAVAAYNRLLTSHPNWKRNFHVLYSIASRHQIAGRDEEALDAYHAYLASPTTTASESALREQDARLRMHSLYQCGQILSGQRRYERAIATFGDYVTRHANGPDWSSAQKALLDCEYSLGLLHREEKRFEAARLTWATFLENHPLDSRSSSLMLEIAELFAEEAQAREDKESAETRELWLAAIQAWQRVAKKYPNKNEASQALFKIGETYETQLAEFDEAIAAYRSCNFGNYQASAVARLTAMAEESLAVYTERTWRTNEKPKVRLTTRNIEEVTIELYEIDLEAYFRKHLTHRRVEDLDLDLISTDQEIKSPVEGYERFKLIRRDIELPVEGPGVWAVVVVADEQRSTTLVLQSDIDLIVKSSRTEVFAYAQDMRRGTPAAGVEILVGVPSNDGQQGVIEAVTNDKGVARLKFPELEQANSMHVFAMLAGNFASHGVSIHNLSVPTGLTPRGLAYTDRSAYRPGQEVRWRSILRDVENGSFSYVEGTEYLVEVTDSQGRVVNRSKASMSAFGTLSGTFVVDEYAPFGTYTLRCSHEKKASASCTFLVEQYQLQKVELAFDYARDIYFRGETVTVGVEASYYYGAPVSDSPIRFSLPGGREAESRTDENGRATLTFETRDFAFEGQLGFSALLPEEQVSSAGSIQLALRGYKATLKTGRGVYLAGSSFGVDIATTAPNGDSSSQEMTLKVLRLEPGPFNTTSQVEVSSHPLTTDPKSGRASVPLQIDQGGEYELRVEGTDRFKNVIASSKHIFVSAEEDSVQLRFLTDSKRLSVGHTANLALNNRAKQGLALITFEGEGVFDYRIVELMQGANDLEFVVDHEHFPNFVVTASMMDGNRFHNTDIEFNVLREMNVTLELESNTFVPGEMAKANVRVTDQLGRPVQAELSLAVVDAALFELYPDRTPSLSSVFDANTRRTTRMQTVTSCEFSYQGVTRRISDAILAEQERLKQETEWKASRAKVSERLEGVSSGLAAMPQSATTGSDDFFLGHGELEEDEFNDVIGIGGGAGGKFGGRFGGRKNLRAGGGLAQGDSSRNATPGLDADTAFWSAAITTDAKGEAPIEFRVPDKSTRWRMNFRGVGADTLLGEFEASIISKSEFFIELRSPVGPTEGDKPEFGVRVHNLTGQQGPVEVLLMLASEGIAGVKRLRRQVMLGEETVIDITFGGLAPLRATENLTVTAEAKFFDRFSTAADVMQVRPWGVEQVAARSGILESRTVLDLKLPGAANYTSKSLEVYVGAGIDHLVIEAALGHTGTRRFASNTSRVVTQSDAASDLAGACAVLEYLTNSGRPGTREYRDLRVRAESLAARLVSSQNEDGGWGWIGRRATSAVETSCRAMVAIAYAKQRGITVETSTVANGLRYLNDSFRRAAQDADEAKSMLVHALAVHGQGDFGAANRLHRSRHNLSPAALAYTTLALIEMKRAPMAVDIATVLAEKAIFDSGDRRSCVWPTTANTTWQQSELDMAALAVLALQRALPQSPAVDAGMEYLLANRPWKSYGSKGAMVEALAHFAGTTQPTRDNMRVIVRVGDKVHPLQLSKTSPGEFIRVDLPNGQAANTRVELELQGRGRPHYSATLRGFDPTMKALEETSEHFSRTTFRYMTVAPTYKGAAIPTGHNVLRNSKLKRVNEIANLAVGERALVQVEYRTRSNARQKRDYDYTVLEIPIPAGTRVLEDTLLGRFESFDLRGGLLTVYIGGRSGSCNLSFELLGANPGTYRALPVRLSSALHPERYAYFAADPLTVLPLGSESPDKYEATPDELYHLGKALFDDGEHEAAHTQLAALFDKYEKDLDLSILQATANMLLHMSIDRGESNAIVRYFEVLKEKNPSLTIAFDRVLRVADAYRELREFERALLIYRAVIEETYGKDLKVAGTLRNQNEFSGATDTLERLWLEYPDFPVSLQTQLALTDMLLRKAPGAARDKSLRKAGRDRAALTTQGILMLKRFLSMYPESPLAPEAALNLVSAYLGLEDYETAADLAGEMAVLYEEPKFMDAFLYSRAVAEWYLGKNKEAQALLQQIADANYPTASGGTKPSENRDLALYILGQIRHAQRDFAGAADYYERVADLFVDAKEALAGFNEKQLAVEEVTTSRPGEPVAFDVDYKNLEEVELLVYSVDLMTLYLREQNLSNITQVNLAGISPTLRKTVALEKHDDLRSAEQTLDLELEEAGAYLVICRGGDLFSSGLVLVSNLELEVKEDPRNGRLRVQVLDVESGNYVRDVDVRVVGSNDGAFRSGKTDPRGLFVANAVRGRSTVIARLDGRQFAFHRGDQELLLPPNTRPGGGGGGGGGGPASPGPSGPQRSTDSYLDNVIGFNQENFREQQQAFDKEVNKVRAGVQVLQVK